MNIIFTPAQIMEIKKEIILDTPDYDSGVLYEFKLFDDTYGDLYCSIRTNKKKNYIIRVRYAINNKLIIEDHPFIFNTSDDFYKTEEYKKLVIIKEVIKNKNNLGAKLQGKSEGIIVRIDYNFVKSLMDTYEFFYTEFTFEYINGVYTLVEYCNVENLQ